MAAYYNEFDPYAAQWLRNLIAAGHIAPGEVDDCAPTATRSTRRKPKASLKRGSTVIPVDASDIT